MGSYKSTKGKKAQVWYTDFIVSVLIFTIAMTIYFEYVNNLSKEEESQLDEMLTGAKTMSNNLMSEGYPTNWNQSDVDIIGIVEDTKVDQEKIEQFYNMSHDTAKFKFGISNNYYFYLQDRDGQKIQVDGKEYAGKEPTNPSKLVKLDRVTIYNNSIVKAVVQIWY